MAQRHWPWRLAVFVAAVVTPVAAEERLVVGMTLLQAATSTGAGEEFFLFLFLFFFFFSVCDFLVFDRLHCTAARRADGESPARSTRKEMEIHLPIYHAIGKFLN
jgi:hypothetical protein